MASQPTFELLVAAFTPFKPTSDGAGVQLDESVLQAQFSYFRKMGIHGVFLNGTTGESFSLSLQERKRLAELWMNAVANDSEANDKGRFKVIVHIGAESLVEAQELAAHAAKLKADAIAIMGPSFFKIDSMDGLVQWVKSIADVCPELPCYYYHFPNMNGLHFNMEKFLTAAKDKVKNLAGMKFTDYNLYDFSRCVRHGSNGTDTGPYNMLFGREDVLLPALTVSAAGMVSSCFNFMAPVASRVVKAFRAGDMQKALEEQARIQAVCRILSDYNPIAASKAITEMIGIPVGPLRLPLKALDKDARVTLEKSLRDIGFFEWSN